MNNNGIYLSDQAATLEENVPLIEVKNDLCELPVYWNDRDAPIGRVTDALIAIENGRLNALLFRGESGQKYLARQRAFMLGERRVYVEPEEVEPEPNWNLPGVAVQRSLHDALMLANEGYLLGRIRHVYVQPHELRIVYCVARSWWERRCGRGFYLPGQAALGFSHVPGVKPRLVVPFNTMERYACTTLEEALDAGRA